MDRKIHNSYIPPWGMVVLHIGLECSFCEYIYSNTVLLSGTEDQRATHPNIMNINIVNAIQIFYSYIRMAKPVSHPSTTKSW